MLRGNSKDILLDTFKDNKAQEITAADMREFVNAIYHEMALVDDIVDNTQSTDVDKAFSAKQGHLLAQAIINQQAEIAHLHQRLDDIYRFFTGANGGALSGVTGDFSNFPVTMTIQNGLIQDIK